ncbi:MAG: amidohydrolase family protein [Acidobacteriota bacterium]
MIINVLYMPMLMLSGATIPITSMPGWLQTFSQFLPAAHFMTGIQSILRGKETFADNLSAVGALLLTTVVGAVLGLKLFRWEKEEKMRPSAKLWLAAVLAPFLVLGVWQAYAKTNIERAKLLQRDVARSHAWLIRDARIFVGDGTVLERASVLVKDGKIDKIFIGDAPDAKTLEADPIEAAGKTLLPGLIDVHVHLTPSGAPGQQQSTSPDANYDRELAYSGVTAVKSVGDGLTDILKHRATMASGQRLGAELFAVGPMFTVEGGHGTEFIKYVPQQYRDPIAQEIVRLPKTADEARVQVAALKAQGVDGIKAILEAAGGSTTFPRLDPEILKAIAEAARKAGLPLVVHTGRSRDVADAVAAGASGVEHGSMTDAISPEIFALMKATGMSYDPTLAVVEALKEFILGGAKSLERSLARQVMPANMIEGVKANLNSQEAKAVRASFAAYPFSMEASKANATSAYRAGVTLVAGTDSGNPMMIHGPGIHRELQLWVEAGIPPAAALQGATYNAARLLKADNRIGLVKQGLEANLLLVDGNPLEEIAATERISTVLFKGERVDRSKLFDQK